LPRQDVTPEVESHDLLKPGLRNRLGQTASASFDTSVRMNTRADGSAIREAASAGAHERSEGPPQASSTPTGGSEPHAVGGVGAIFHWPVRIYWEDTDAGGIVFYANYLKFFERSRTEWLRSLGIAQQQLKNESGGMFVVLETQLRYLRPARLDDELTVTAFIRETGRASLIIGQQALLKTERNRKPQQPADTMTERSDRPCAGLRPTVPAAEAVLCEGTIRIGWVDSATMLPRRIPQAVLLALKATQPGGPAAAAATT
jgi:acyl-CoA thioester hydrolase